MSFPNGSVVKNLQCRSRRRCKFDPWVRKIPWRKAWKSTPVFLPGEARGYSSLAAVHRVVKSWTRLEQFSVQHISNYKVTWINFKTYFQLEDNGFTILCWLLPYNMNQLHIYTCPIPLEPSPTPPPHPTLVGCHRALH